MRRRKQQFTARTGIAVVFIAGLLVPEGRSAYLVAGQRVAHLASCTPDCSATVAASRPRPKAAPVRRPGKPQQGVTCATLPAGIRMQESGGNYRVRGVPVRSHSGARAMGAYQLMPANLPSWSREALGREVTVAQFMSSRTLQDRIATYHLGRLCAAHGPRGAAAAWFSGRPSLHDDYKPRGGGAASVGVYVDSAMALARRYG